MLQAGFDVRVLRVELRSPLVGIKCVADLVVAGLVQSTQVVPNLRDKGIQANSPRVCVEGIPILVDLIVEHTN